MATIDVAVGQHRVEWDWRVVKARKAQEHAKGKDRVAQGVIDEEQRVRRMIVNLAEMIDARDSLIRAIDQAYVEAKPHLSPEMDAILSGAKRQEAA